MFRDLARLTGASKFKGFSVQFLQRSGKKEVLEKEKCKSAYFRKDLPFYLQ